jgi:fatty-acyl-CoA synthase
VKLADCLDLGAALVPAAPCLVTETTTLSYAETQGLSRSVAASLGACEVREADTVGVLSANDPLALTCIMGASRAGAAWALLDPSDADVAELAQELSRCSLLFFRARDAELVRQLQLHLPLPHVLVVLDGHVEGALGWGEFLVTGLSRMAVFPVGPPAYASDDAAASEDRPIFLALGPLTEATADRWQAVLAMGGRIVMRTSQAAPKQHARLEA